MVGCTERSILGFSVVFSSPFAPTTHFKERRLRTHLQSSVSTKIRTDTQSRSRNECLGGCVCRKLSCPCCVGSTIALLLGQFLEWARTESVTDFSSSSDLSSIHMARPWQSQRARRSIQTPRSKTCRKTIVAARLPHRGPSSRGRGNLGGILETIWAGVLASQKLVRGNREFSSETCRCLAGPMGYHHRQFRTPDPPTRLNAEVMPARSCWTRSQEMDLLSAMPVRNKALRVPMRL